jgi:hypothetical protein
LLRRPPLLAPLRETIIESNDPGTSDSSIEIGDKRAAKLASGINEEAQIVQTWLSRLGATLYKYIASLVLAFHPQEPGICPLVLRHFARWPERKVMRSFPVGASHGRQDIMIPGPRTGTRSFRPSKKSARHSSIPAMLRVSPDSG